ncbi:MAG TPA: tail fiber domain-containing protein [Parafilimonas sp.]|nr:tail fiber domain-containing protein [Parafilimonas sp.]
MKTNKYLITALALTIGAWLQANAQSWNINGNANIAAGTNYLGTSDPNDLVFRTNALERGRILGNGGSWRFGSGNNYTQIDSSGKLTFSGKGTYQVAANKYVFQYKNDADYGLFFNSADLRYEFRNSTANPVFYINAANGSLSIGDALAGQNYILPSSRGSNNQVLKTDATGNVSWQQDKNTSYAAGTGLSLDGDNIFTNTAPDQVVSLTAIDGITTSGTYPNFTISANNLWRLNGNTGTNALNNFVGTRDSADLVFRTNNTTRMRITGDGNVGIGTGVPKAKLQVSNGQEVSLNAGGSFVIGPMTSNNLAMDNNEIQARNNGAAGTLFLNTHGGRIQTGGDLQVIGSIDATNGISSDGNIDAGGDIRFGIHGEFSDVGSWTISSNTAIESSWDGLDGLGSSSHRWSEVWAQDGVINTSDLRDKTNIRDLNYGLKEILKLRSVKFNWKESASKEDKLGLIAQELQKVMPEVVRDYEYKRDENGNRKKVQSARLGVSYDDLIPVLIKAIQEQQQEIEALKKVIGHTTASATTPSTPVNSNEQSNVKLGAATLEQNVPNPLRNTTSIRYNISKNTKNASLLITDMSGKSIKQISIKPGTGSINLDATSLNAGTYIYTLIADGNKIESKRMVVAK